MKAMRLMIVVFLVAAPCSLVSAAGSSSIVKLTLQNKYSGKELETIIVGNPIMTSSPFAGMWNESLTIRGPLADYAMEKNKYNIPLDSAGNYLLHFLVEDYGLLKAIWEKPGNEAKLKDTLDIQNKPLAGMGGPKTPLDVVLQNFDVKGAEFLIEKGAALGDVDAKMLKVFSGLLTNAESDYNSNETKAGIATLKLLIQKGASADTLEKTVKVDVARKYSEYWYQDDSSDTKHQDAGNKIFAELKASGSGSGGGSGPSSASFNIQDILDGEFSGNKLNKPISGADTIVNTPFAALWNNRAKNKLDETRLKEMRQCLAEYVMADKKLYEVRLGGWGNYLLHYLVEDYDLLKATWAKSGNEATLKEMLKKGNTFNLGGGSSQTPLDVALTEYNAQAVEFLIAKGANLGDVNDKVVKVLDVGIHEFMWNSDPVKMLAVKETLVVLLRRGADVDKVKEKMAANSEIWWWQDQTHQAKAEEVLAEAKALAAAGSGGGGSGPSSGSATPLDDLKTALEALKAKLAALATALKP